MNIMGFVAAMADDLAALSGHTVAKNAFVGTKAAAAVVVDDLTVTAGVVTEENGQKKILTPVEQEVENKRAAAREIPVLMKIAKGSLINKAKIIPTILIAGAINPVIIGYMLTAGGAYLAYEAAEAVLEKAGILKEHEEEHNTDNKEVVKEETHEEAEQKKIKSAIKMDLVLSLEILIIASATIAGTSIIGSAAALSAVGVAATVGVYGVVAGIVKIDDLGMHLEKSKNTFTKKFGKSLVKMMPYLLKTLSIVGTAAMGVVGGNILLEHLPMLHSLAEMVHHLPNVLPYLAEIGVAIAAGSVIIGAKKVLSPVISYVKNKFNKLTSFFKKDSDKKETEVTTIKEVEELEVEVTEIVTQLEEVSEKTENLMLNDSLEGTKEILSDIQDTKTDLAFKRYTEPSRTDKPDIDIDVPSEEVEVVATKEDLAFKRYTEPSRTDKPDIDIDIPSTQKELQDSSPKSIKGEEFSMWSSMFAKKNPNINTTTKKSKK
jgi:hypothetical protein